MDTANDTIDCKEQEEAADTNNWKWLRSVLEELGEDGMSSEESDNDGDIEIVYRPKIMEWRRNMDKELKILDDENRRLAKTRSQRGAKLVPRRRSAGNKLSSRDPVCGLPVCFYKESWLAKQTDAYVERTLNLSQKKFRWRDLLVE